MFKGTLPSECGNLRSLKDFQAHHNVLSGDMAQSLFDLTDIEVLRLDGNNFSGVIRPLVGNFRKIKELRLDNNQLVGTLPNSGLYQLSTLGKPL
jgi:hypothetical protein